MGSKWDTRLRPTEVRVRSRVLLFGKGTFLSCSARGHPPPNSHRQSEHRGRSHAEDTQAGPTRKGEDLLLVLQGSRRWSRLPSRPLFPAPGQKAMDRNGKFKDSPTPLKNSDPEVTQGVWTSPLPTRTRAGWEWTGTVAKAPSPPPSFRVGCQGPVQEGTSRPRHTETPARHRKRGRGQTRNPQSMKVSPVCPPTTRSASTALPGQDTPAVVARTFSVR